MIINNNSPNISQYQKQTTSTVRCANTQYKNYSHSQITFGGKPPQKADALFKKIRNYTLAGILALAGINVCSDKTTKGSDNIDNIKVEYFNVDEELKDSVIKPVINLKAKLNEENDFLDGLEIDITKKFKNLDDENSFREFVKNEREASSVKGISFYSDGKLPSRIIIQENAHLEDKAKNYKNGGRYSAIPALKQSMMHEIGHHFDSYYGHNHDAKFAQKWDSLLYEKEINPETNPYDFDYSNIKDKRINVDYTWNSGLSDKKVFQEALLKDINSLKNFKKEDLPENIEYYIGGFDISKTISKEDIDYAEHQRSEVYANLFSYALGEDEGDKEKFVKCFSNSYEVVKNDISEYLKIQL